MYIRYSIACTVYSSQRALYRSWHPLCSEAPAYRLWQRCCQSGSRSDCRLRRHGHLLPLLEHLQLLRAAGAVLQAPACLLAHRPRQARAHGGAARAGRAGRDGRAAPHPRTAHLARARAREYATDGAARSPARASRASGHPEPATWRGGPSNRSGRGGEDRRGGEPRREEEREGGGGRKSEKR